MWRTLPTHSTAVSCCGSAASHTMCSISIVTPTGIILLLQKVCVNTGHGIKVCLRLILLRWIMRLRPLRYMPMREATRARPMMTMTVSCRSSSTARLQHPMTHRYSPIHGRGTAQPSLREPKRQSVFRSVCTRLCLPLLILTDKRQRQKSFSQPRHPYHRRWGLMILRGISQIAI